MSEMLTEKFEELMEAEATLQTIYEKEARVIQSRHIEALECFFGVALDSASASEIAILLFNLVRAMKDRSIEDARKKGATWRETARSLGEADGLEAVENLLGRIFGIAKNQESF
jgi:hypothetical protein